MRPVIKIVLAVSCLLVLSACGSEGAPTATATRAATVPAAATATPSGASGTATATPSAASSTSAQASPVVEKRIITDRRAIPFKTMSVNDSTLSKGTTRVRNTGSRGVEILTYKATFLNGIQTHKELIRKVIVRAPVTRVIAVGIKETQQCDPNYSGACVPIASDVDCAGGSGNGPAYVQGPVQVVGTDIYGLDRDGDGIGCEQG
jgi:resuscitation-promoting factor RpfB